MKKHETEKLVRSYFSEIHKLLPGLINDFNNTDILEYRKEIKRLKSFFHLLDMSENGDPVFHVPQKLKTIYGYSGIIRNLHLQLQSLNSYLRTPSEMMLPIYTSRLKNEISSWEKTARDFVQANNNYYDDEEKIFEIIPEKIKENSIKKFVQYISYELQVQLGRLTNDEVLHNIRKLLEDIYYNIPFVNHYMSMMPEGLRQGKEINSFIEQLSVFRDKCISVTILKTWYNESVDTDRLVTESIIEGWTAQKNQLKDAIIYRLELIPLKPLVKRLGDIHIRS